MRGRRQLLFMLGKQVARDRAREEATPLRVEAIHRCGKLLESQGFRVQKPRFRDRRVLPPDLIASKRGRLVRIVVVADGEVDERDTRQRILASVRRGETRVYVHWTLRWRALSNLARWEIQGVAVEGW